MSVSRTRLTELQVKYVSGEITPEEQKELDSFLGTADNRRRFELRIEQQRVRESIAAWDVAATTEKENWADVPKPKRTATLFQLFNPLRKRLTVAAAFLVIALGTFLLYRRHATTLPIKQIVTTPTQDIQPGGNKATLTLANGTKILLDDAKIGALAQEGTIQVNKTNNGTLTYTAKKSNEKPEKEELLFNMLTTPRAGTFRIVLPDQTVVWLNSASSLRYPASFDGQADREVSLTGEAYFEVAKNATKLFRVHVGDMLVDVLGTNFNVNAYHDEPTIKTTLLTGSVKISQHVGQTLLKPGEQALLNPNNQFKIAQVDVNASIAWKNGFFNFDRSDLPAVMRQIARWFDVEVIYKTDIPHRSFSGVIDRQLTLSQVLKILESYGVHSTIEGRKLFVTL